MEIYDRESKDFKSENVNLFGDCEKVLEELEEGRIFNIYYNKQDDEYCIHEMCDQYFGMTLTTEMCEDLSELFSKIAEKIKKE